MHESDITVRIFGSLRPYREERGLPVTFQTTIATGGTSGHDLALSLGLPPDMVEGI